MTGLAQGVREALLYGLPWWIIAGLVGGAVILAGLRLGWRAAGMAGLAGLLLIVDRRAAQRGWRDRQRKEEIDAAHALEAARLARLGAERDALDPVRLRADDGWRRDGGVLPGSPPHQLDPCGHGPDHPRREGP
ncbi:hypothetical protein J5J86_10915 [Aquabacter sp. L1I39]|uniref:hypothetical protein n=1 Tax=Aquabacter sp. L1I39 TaxID=2820278 RepID=UPI001ADA4D71|nr:hypothetical protein [Aquabacter sp. L1I39]QTL05751.1 hypothetical protein J5J86_10915 [Aquabacter sp. L1I39]